MRCFDTLRNILECKSFLHKEGFLHNKQKQVERMKVYAETSNSDSRSPERRKSTIFNRIVGERVSIVEDIPGVTRDRIYSAGEWLNHEFNIIDTGGIDIGDEPFLTQIRQQAEVAIDEADVIIL